MQKEQNNLQHIQWDWWDWLLWSLKNSFLAANTEDGFCEHRDKKSTHVYNETYCCIFDVEVLDILFRHMASWILSNTNRF